MKLRGVTVRNGLTISTMTHSNSWIVRHIRHETSIQEMLSFEGRTMHANAVP